MAIKHGSPNALNYFQLRKVNYGPPQFEYITIDTYRSAAVRNISAWIEENLNSRYYIGRTLVLDTTNTYVYNTCIGFENVKEKTVFLLSCPFI